MRGFITDGFLLAGVACFAIGLSKFSTPLAAVFVGVVCVWLAFEFERGRDKSDREAESKG